MKILQIDTDSTDNGFGLRTVIYVAGCSHACKGCHNIFSWRVKNGTEMSVDEIIERIEENPLADVTISGGDPLTFQYEETLELLKAIKIRTKKNVWLYTGYVYEDLLLSDKKKILDYVNVLVDGKFVIGQRDLSTIFRGSSNQRLIDVRASLLSNWTILLRQS